MSLAEILKQIKANQEFANTPVENEPRETYAGRFGRQQRALESLKELKTAYRKELRNNAMFIIVAGSAKEAFTGFATGFGLFAADPTELYTNLADRINTALYQSNSSTHDLFQVFGRHLEDKAMELGVVEYPQPIFKQEYRRNITSKDGVVQLIMDAVNQQVGAELSGLQAVHSITDQAIAANHASKTTPILLSTSNDQLALDLLAALPRITKNVFLVNAGKSTKALKGVQGSLSVKEVTTESVEQTLSTIKSLIKK